MQQSRRKFLQLTGAAAAGLTLTGLSSHSLFAGDFERRKLKNFGIQLYTLRDDMPKDPKGVLKQLASFGYKQIESYEGPEGMFWGMSNTDFKKIMDDLDMTIVSSHCDISIEFEKKAGEAAAIGMKYLVFNWPGGPVKMDEFKRKADLFNKCGEVCRREGIRFANHNYDQSFITIDGEIPMDTLMKNTDPLLVDYQMDIYWVVMGGEDPIAWLKKYPNRFRLCHIKDRVKGTTKREDTCDLGTGSIDFPSILKTARKNRMEYFIAEQEHYPNSTPMKSAAADAEYLKRLKF